MPAFRPLEERLWEGIDKNGPMQPHMTTPCWVWTGALRNGYGYIGVDAHHSDYVHRVVWRLEHGPIPEGKMVLHDCDFRPCARHLYLGNRKRNALDAVERGRSSRGSERPIAKLTEEKVLAMRAAFTRGSRVKDLSVEYGVSTGTTADIVHRKSWRHV